MNDARKLYQLQQIDLEIEAKKRALTGVLRQKQDDFSIQQARAAWEQAHQWLHELEKVQRATEAEVEDKADKLRQVEKKLYSGKVTNLKELASLQAEFEQLKAEVRRREDRVLEVMGEVEAAQKSLKAQEDRFYQVEAQWQQLHESLDRQQAAIESELNNLKEKRALLSADIEHHSLENYEGLRIAKQGRAVARVEQGRCQGCRLSLSINELNQVRGSSLVQCSSCQRILFLD